MRTIYKYKLDEYLQQEILMPQGAKILCVQIQNRIPCIWADVDPENSETAMTFKVYGTGWETNRKDNEIYVGTYQLDGLVFHVFNLINP